MRDEMASNTRITDMTKGNPTKHILLFAFPLFIGNLFQQLYNMIDSLVVGNYVGANALASIGTCSSLNFLFFSLSSGLAIGIGIIVSQYFGAKDETGVKNTIANSIYVLAIASVIATLTGVLLARPLLTILSTPKEIIDDAVLYLRVTCCGIIFIAIYNGIASVLRALGDSRTPLYFLIFSSLCNICLDLFFVLNLNMGVFGVALATVLSQCASATISFTYAMIKIPYFRLSKEEIIPHFGIIARCFRLGVPMALQSSMIAISLIVLQGVVNKFGATVMAAYTISGKIDLVVSQLYGALSQALTTYAGQNLGANDINRVKKGLIKGEIITFVYNLVASPLIFIFSASIVSIFVKDPAVIEIGSKAIRITSVLYFFLGSIYVPRGTLNGCGDAKFSLINGITEVACRIIFVSIFTRIPGLGMWGVWYATGFTWITVSIICHLRYFKGAWKKMRLI